MHDDLADADNGTIVPVSLVAEPSVGFTLPHFAIEVGAHVGAIFESGESWLVAGGFVAFGGRFGRENRCELRVRAGGAVREVGFTGLSLGWFFG